MLGNILFQSKLYDYACYYYEKVVSTDSNNKNIMLNKGICILIWKEMNYLNYKILIKQDSTISKLLRLIQLIKIFG